MKAVPSTSGKIWRWAALAVIGYFIYTQIGGGSFNASYYEGAPKTATPGYLAGQPVQDLQAEDLQGTTRSLADYRGKTVLLSFWAPWCPPCRKEIPSMVRLKNNLKAGDIEIIAVATQYETAAEVRALAKSMNVNFPVLLDSDDNLSALFKVRSLPTNMLIDPNGIIRVRTGPRHWDDHAAVEQVLKAMGEGTPAS